MSTNSIAGKGTIGVNADGLELSSLIGDNCGRRGTSHVEGVVQGHPDGDDIRSRDAETCGRQSDLGDEIIHLGFREVHEPVDLELTRIAGITCEHSHTLHRTSEQRAEVLVEMADEEVLRRGIRVGRHICHKGSGATVVEEVDHGRCAVDVGRLQGTVKVF